MEKDTILGRFNCLKINKFIFVLLLVLPSLSWAGEGSKKEGKDEQFDPTELINHHISDAHSWEIFHGLTVYLPVIIYSEEKGLEIFSSSNFYDEHHHEKSYNGYVMDHEHIALESGGHVFDISITKNVLFLLIDAVLLILVFTAVARGYKKNVGRSPKGIQSFFEPIIVFIRDDIAKENIGKRYERVMPFLLT
ncbi:MAG: F0F1 ATP synthase subunit A, partial [Bacteroidota bacterium]